MNPSPTFYAIIPAHVRYCKNIEPNAKLLYGEITALTQKEGYCWASNAYLAELYDVDERTISNWLKSLSDEGFIKIETKKVGMTWDRKIWIIQEKFTTGQKLPDREVKNVPVEGKKTSTDVLHSNINTVEIKQQQHALAREPAAAPAAAAYQSIEFTNLKGQKEKVSQSDIFQHFLKTPFPTSVIEEAINQLRKTTDPIGNVFKFLESICLRIENKAKTSIKPQKNHECTAPKNTAPAANWSEYQKQNKEKKI